MTVFTRTWDAAYMAQPADGENINLGATRIRNGRTDIQERVAVDHSFDGDANDGKHNKVTLVPQALAPTLDAGDGALYGQTASGTTEVFYKNSNGVVQQITQFGGLWPFFGDLSASGTLSVVGDATFGANAYFGGDTSFALDAAGTDRVLRFDAAGATDTVFYFDRVTRKVRLIVDNVLQQEWPP